jgi:hypothetical protein
MTTGHGYEHNAHFDSRKTLKRVLIPNSSRTPEHKPPSTACHICFAGILNNQDHFPKNRLLPKIQQGFEGSQSVGFASFAD